MDAIRIETDPDCPQPISGVDYIEKTGSPQITNDPIFPTDIFFFGGVEEGYIGYSLLDDDRFKATDFYRECKPNYDVVKAKQNFNIGESLDPYSPNSDSGELDDNEDVEARYYDGKWFIPP